MAVIWLRVRLGGPPLIAAVLLVLGCAPDRDADSMQARTFAASSGKTLPYRLFVPETDGARLPLVVFLHGGTGSGTDNVSQVSTANRRGVRVWMKTDNQARHPCFVLAPQLPKNWRWDASGYKQLSSYAEALVELLGELQGELSIDTDRVYLTGQSLGGWGTWDLIVKRADLFAAAVPVCGGGDASGVTALRNFPVWAFHGRRDEQVPVEHSREMVAALKEAGAAVRYTEYENMGHNVWDRAYGEEELVDWLFAQRRASG